VSRQFFAYLLAYSRRRGRESAKFWYLMGDTSSEALGVTQATTPGAGNPDVTQRR